MRMMKATRTIGLIFVLALLGGFPVNLPAQVTGATLSGTVTDPQKAVIPTATVSIKNEATGIVRKVKTNSDGLYVAPNLQPGPYAITFSAEGFKTVVQRGVQLTVGQDLVLNEQLTVGAVSQAVEVKGTGALIETTSSAISNVVSGLTTRELPLNGRDWTQLATLDPGVTEILTQPSANGLKNRGNRGFGTQFTISGGRPQQNNYRLDGISINDYANSSPGSSLGLSLGVGAIQEFSVITTNYSAAYGFTSGGVVNAITRSGTNQWHGSAYEFFRNDALDARDFFDTTRLPFHRNQFGASIGGPIQKDKTFIFGDYEGLRQSLTTTSTATVPSPAARQGNLSSGTVTVDPSVAPYLDFWHLPNNGISGDFGSYSFPARAVSPEDFFTIRADHTINSSDSIHGTYLFDNGSTTLPDSLNVMLNANKVRRQTLSVDETHIFTPTFLNTLRGGMNRVADQTLATLPGANSLGTDQRLGIEPGLYAPIIGVTGLTQFQGGLNGTSHGIYGFTTGQLYDDAFWTKGIHSIRFGFAFLRIDSNFLLTASPNGVYKFSSLADFLTNNPHSLQMGLTPATPRGLRQSAYGAYLNDDIQLKPNLTVNAGLRYEAASVPSEVQNKMANLRSLTSATVYTGSPFFNNPTLHDFEPRVGFAWDPFKKGKTSVRGGFGLFDVLPLTYQFNLIDAYSAPFFEFASSTHLAQGAFPLAGVSDVVAAKLLREAYVQFNPPRNYVMQWNFTIQQAVLPSLSVMVGYVGNHGVHQPTRTSDANAVQPTVTSSGLEWPCITPDPTVPGFCDKAGGTVVNPLYGQIDGQVYSGSSVYDAMVVEVRKTMAHGFQLQGSFTWSKAFDDTSSNIAGGAFANSISGQLLEYPLRGLSDFNVTRNLVINGLWNIPKPGNMPAVPKAILKDWQIGGIFQASDGMPFTPLVGGNPLALGTTTTFDIPDRVNGPGCGAAINPGNVQHYINVSCFALPNPSTRLGDAGRNSLIGPGLINMDFSLIRNIPLHRISESSSLQFRAEFFNLFNRANFEPPLSNQTLFIYNPENPTASETPVSVAGRITSTSTPPREIQFGLNFVF